MNIIPIILVVAIGLIFGIVLTVASKIMFVPIDEIVAKVREELPGANCGACGFAGCDDYAAAFGEDKETSITRCPVGGADLAARLGELLGVEASAGAPPVAVVMCQGNNNVAKDVLEYGKNMTCKEASTLFGGAKACTKGCLGLGDCVAACDFGALKIVDGIACVDRDLCVGCAACAKACPKSVIEILTKDDRVSVRCHSVDKGAKVMKACKSGCIGCKKCENTCKFDAIHVEGNLAKIDYDKCKNCGLCAKECPTGAIVVIPKTKKVVVKAEPEVKAEA
ncbi:MAG: RnfABCDGE type electron transport complex subunit B [Anaerovoracaceae bacterium]